MKFHGQWHIVKVRCQPSCSGSFAWLWSHTGLANRTGAYWLHWLLTGWETVTSRQFSISALDTVPSPWYPGLMQIWCSISLLILESLHHIVAGGYRGEGYHFTMEVVRPPADPAGGKLHGRHPRGGFDHAIQSLHFNYQQRSCIGLTIVLDGRILLCTAEKLVIRDHSSWKHVGCLMYTYSYRIRNGLTMRAHWEGFARYSWQACIPRSFFQMSCWWSIYTYFNNTFFICDGLTTVLDVRIWLGSAEKLWTPRFFFLTACWWPFLLSQFGSARLLEWLLVFFGLWFYQVSGLTVMLATLLMLFVSRRPAGVCGLLGRFSIIGITCLRCSSNSGSERHFGTYFFTSCFSGSSCTDWIAKVCPSWQPVSQLCLLMGGANTLTKKVCA